MQPAQLLAREEAAWQDFVRSLGAHLADVWPAVQERLADRYDAFVEHAVQQALARGLRHAAGVAQSVDGVVVGSRALAHTSMRVCACARAGERRSRC